MSLIQRLTRFFLLLEFRLKRSDFYRDLAEMFRRSEPMLVFLEGEIANSYATRQHSRAAALRLILKKFQSGENAGRLGHLLSGVVPSTDAMLLLAVDRASDKPHALEALAQAVDQQGAMRLLMLRYSALPLAMLPLCYILMALLSQVILEIQTSSPDFIQDELWKGFNGVARQIAHFTHHHGLTAFIAGLALVIGLVIALPRWRGLVRLRLENWPIFGLYRDFQVGLLLTSLAMLLQSGHTLKGAIEDLSGPSSRWLRWHLRRILSSLDDNPNATIEAFGHGFLSRHLLARASTLKRSAPTFSDVLIELGTREGPRVLQRVKHSALVTNIATVGVLFGLSGVMAMASLTVPSRFTALMEPTSRMMLQSAHAARVSQSTAGTRP